MSEPSKEMIELWAAVNEYTRSCGGDPGGPATDRRMDAVARVSSAVEAAGRDWPAVADAAALRDALAGLMREIEEGSGTLSQHDPSCPANEGYEGHESAECDCGPDLDAALHALAGAGGREMLRRYRQAVGFVSDFFCSEEFKNAPHQWRARAKDILSYTGERA